MPRPAVTNLFNGDRSIWSRPPSVKTINGVYLFVLEMALVNTLFKIDPTNLKKMPSTPRQALPNH